MEKHAQRYQDVLEPMDGGIASGGSAGGAEEIRGQAAALQEGCGPVGSGRDERGAGGVWQALEVYTQQV
eukprot:11155331-Lingulodinium_polyedra.AAC.1